MTAGRARELIAETHLPGTTGRVIREIFEQHLGQTCGGLSFSVYREGEPLVRLHGGSQERRETPDEAVVTPWTDRTLAVMFSGTKGLVATLAAMLVDDGVLDVHAPVAEYWPEFAAAGKERVTVAQVLNHTVGLIYTDPDPVDSFFNLAAHSEILARQKPVWNPGSKVAYHAVTFGYLVEAVLVRITGKRAGQLLAERVVEPYGLDLYLGLPESEEHRVAPVFRAPGYAISTFLQDPERRAIVDRMYGDALLGDELPANSRAFHAAGIASGGALGGADSIARAYSLVESGALVSSATRELFTRTWSEGLDAVNDRPLRFGLGYELQDPIHTYGPVERAYGHSGAGGCLHGAWPDYGIGFSFHTNEMLSENVDRRAKDLLGALRKALES